MKSIFLTLALAVLVSPAISDAASPVNNLKEVAIPVRSDGTQFPVEEIQAVILESCLSRNWTPRLEGDGSITAMIDVRGKHSATVRIPFSSESYSILYVSSENLDYNPKRESIHRNYNGWVVKLSQTISYRLRTAARVVASAPGTANVEIEEDVSTELLKLAVQRDKGLLTQEEFDAERKKLLDRH